MRKSDRERVMSIVESLQGDEVALRLLVELVEAVVRARRSKRRRKNSPTVAK